MEQELAVLNSEIRRLNSENNKKQEENLINNAEIRRLRNQVLDLQKKMQNLEKCPLEAVNELTYTKSWFHQAFWSPIALNQKMIDYHMKEIVHLEAARCLRESIGEVSEGRNLGNQMFLRHI